MELIQGNMWEQVGSESITGMPNSFFIQVHVSLLTDVILFIYHLSDEGGESEMEKFYILGREEGKFMTLILT